MSDMKFSICNAENILKKVLTYISSGDILYTRYIVYRYVVRCYKQIKVMLICYELILRRY